MVINANMKLLKTSRYSDDKGLSIRQQYVVSKRHNLVKILSVLADGEKKSYSELKKAAYELKGGSFSAALRDCRNLKLVVNGDRFRITVAGKRFLEGKDRLIDRDVGSYLPLFKDMHTMGIRSRRAAQKFLTRAFSSHYGEESLKNIVSQSSLRYLELFYGQARATKARRQIRNSHGVLTLKQFEELKAIEEDIVAVSEKLKKILHERKHVPAEIIVELMKKKINQQIKS